MSDAPDPFGVLPPWQHALLAQALSMPGHALLLQGASGLGQYELAFALAQAWLCENEQRAATDPACGQCESCLQIHARSHTDLVVLMPEKMMLELGWPLSERAQNEIAEKDRKPSQEIRIDTVRDVVTFSGLTSGRGRAKVVLIYPAEAMNSDSANALLKTLEEPFADLHFVLASEAADQLLPTVRSRCQTVAVKQPSEAQVRKWLDVRLSQLDPIQRQLALRASGGRPMDALALASNASLQTWSQVPLAMQKGQVSVISAWTAAQLLDALHKLCHDLWAVKLGSEPRFFDTSELPKPPTALALSNWHEQLKAWSRVIDHPFKAELMIEDLVQQAKVCINSRL